MAASLLSVAPFLLALGTFFLPSGAPIRHGAAGTALVSLAVAAAVRVADGTVSFHSINNALFCGGLILAGVSLAEGWRRGQRQALLPLALALVLALAGYRALLLKGHLVVSLLAGLAVAATLVALRPPAAVSRAEPKTPGRVRALLQQWGRPILLAALLIPALWLTLTVAGPGNISLRGLRAAPFSPAAETLLAALLLPATLVISGVFPFGGSTRGPRLAPLGALLLLALLPLAGDGVAHWRSVYAGWLALGALVAAWNADWPRFLTCSGLFAVACGGGSVSWAGASLTVIASLLSLSPPVHDAVSRLALLVAAGCGMVALGETLGSEVVYSTLMVLASVIGIQRTSTDQAATTSR